MSQRNTKLKTYLTESNTEMRRKLINIGIETEKEKDSKRLYLTRNKDNKLKFPNIQTYNKINGIKTKYNNNIFYNNINKNLNIYSDYIETDSDIPIITSKINGEPDKYLFSNSVKKYKDNYNTLNINNYLDEIEQSNLVLSSVKTPKLNILKYNNISNINNIYNKKDYLKINNAPSNNKNNIRTIIINNLKNNSKSNSSLNDEEKNTIQNLLNKKTIIIKNIHKHHIHQSPKKIKYKENKNEFKDFLKEILKQYKDKNINKVKKKIDINTLLNNKQFKTQNDINKIKQNNLGSNHSKLKDKTIKFNNYINKKKYNYLILRNGLLNPKLNRRNIGMTEDVKIKKRNIFNKYRFKKNKMIMSEVEEELINLEDKIKERFDRFRKNIDDEPGNFE